MTDTPRATALRVLQEVSRRGTLATSLAGAPAHLDERDRAFLHELVLGTLRRRGWLDHVLRLLTERPLARVDARVLDVLRLGAYQLLFMRVPPHAALSQSVELARAVEARAAGFVNAVLRRLQREGPPAAPDPSRDALGWLTSWGSLPSWLAERWLGRLGPERAVARAQGLLEAPPTHFRLNPRVHDPRRRLSEAGVDAVPGVVPDALVLSAGRLAPLAAEGVVYVQDAGSQMIAHLAATEGRVLDACAAPGGKSLLLADLARAHVVAADASRARLRTLRALCHRWGAERVSPVAADARRPPFGILFDAVLLDAPCSGLGTLARHPDIRWRLRPRDLARHAERQRALIEGLAPLVAPGGRLVYATCSVEPEETLEVVQPFLERHQEFAADALPDWTQAHREGPFVRMEPGAGGDAFFAARLRRAIRSAAGAARPPSARDATGREGAV